MQRTIHLSFCTLAVGLLFTAPADALINDPYTNGDTRGAIVQTFGFAPAKFAEHPTLSLIYASVPATNSVAIFNSETLALVDNVFIGSNPGGLSVSPDGSRLYVATGSDFLGVMDTATNTKLDSINIGSASYDVEARADDNLVVLIAGNYIGRGVYSVTPSTGAYDYVREPGTEKGVGSSRGEFAMSPDRQTIYYGNFGTSPAELKRLDFISPTEANATIISPGGGNGQDVGLSRNGELLAYAVGGGNDYAYPYDIAVMRTSDQAILGSFNTGAYPEEVEFSPDAGFAYTANSSKNVKIWSTETFLEVDTFLIDGNERYEEPNELFITKDGRYLFNSTNDGRTLVYATGRTVPVTLPEILGDMNGDGVFTNADISPFVLALTDESAFASQYPGVDPAVIGDFSGDGLFTNGDIAGFVDALTGPASLAAALSTSVPEPSSLAMLGIGVLAVSRRRRSQRHLQR